MSRLCTLLTVLLTTQADMQKNKFNLRVYNGFDDITSKYPYVVCLMPSSDIKDSGIMFLPRMCTGILITSNWVISASHCLVYKVEYIQYGNMSVPLHFTDSKSKVHKTIRHPRYVQSLQLNDIGLLLVSPVSMTKYGRISAVDYRTLVGHPVDYAGYGMTFMGDDTVVKPLNFILDMFKPLQVGEGIVKSCGKDSNLICVSSKCSRKQIALPGDSGGPLLYDQKVVAVACAINADYSNQYFTPISPHLSWIHNTMSLQSP